jgi:hypothetical protein
VGEDCVLWTVQDFEQSGHCHFEEEFRLRASAYRSVVTRLRLDGTGSETSQGQGCSFFSERPSRLCDSPGLLLSGYRSRLNFPSVRRLGPEVCQPPPSTHLDLVPELKMNGVMPLLHLYAFMAQIGTALHLSLRSTGKTKDGLHTVQVGRYQRSDCGPNWTCLNHNSEFLWLRSKTLRISVQ